MSFKSILDNKQTFKVYSNIDGATTYEPYRVYKIVVDYPKTKRILEFIGMDRGSCIMQAEVAKQEPDSLMLMQNEEELVLYRIIKNESTT